MRRIHLPLLIFGLVAAASPAAGQVVYDQASTVGESYARGMSNVIQAQGQYNLQTSESMINVEQARSAELDNRLKSAQTYFEMRNLNTQQRFGDYAQRKAVNSQKRLFRYGSEGRPKRPSNRELDPLTGRISWPRVLQAPDYATARDVVNKQFQARARQEGAIGYDGYEAMNASLDVLSAQLKGNIQQLDPMDYVNCKNFLERLTYEVKYPTD